MKKLRKTIMWLKTMRRLGFSNVVRVAGYRLRLKTGWFKHQLPMGQSYSGPFFSDSQEQFSNAIDIQHMAFGHKVVAIPPKAGWHSNILTDEKLDHASLHWTEIPDFSSSSSDIKTIWEASRFDWLPASLWKAKHSGELKNGVTAAEAAVSDWVLTNPGNIGPNWKCGQETSIRLLNFLLGLKIVNGLETPSASSLRFVKEHLSRVYPTVSYAIGQQNNHATSEAVALFVGGEFLKRHSPEDSDLAFKWAQAGRKLLEHSTNALVMADGTFSQYSMVYHRMMLSLLTLAELFRRYYSLARFSDAFYGNAKKACCWIVTFVHPGTGQVPNMGANDGAHLFNLEGAAYLDFRPSTDAAFAVFHGFRVFGQSALLDCFEINMDLRAADLPAVTHFKEGGYISASQDDIRLFMRVPNYKFRPGQADALHLDIWHKDKNIATDSGTFSYSKEKQNAYFTGTAAHNTVQFDGRDHMPRLGRFLHADWLQVRSNVLENKPDQISFSGSYTDCHGASHTRVIGLRSGTIVVTDEVQGFEKTAKLYWHLAPGEWVFDKNGVTSKDCIIRVESSVEMKVELKESPRSSFYLQCSNAPMLVIEVAEPTTISTRFEFANQ